MIITTITKRTYNECSRWPEAEQRKQTEEQEKQDDKLRRQEENKRPTEKDGSCLQ